MNEASIEWEKEFLEIVSNQSDTKLMKLAYKAEKSIKDELDRQSESDIVTIAVSYLIMFIYILLALGENSNLKSILIDGRFTVGFVGVLIVLLSVVSSLGFFFYLGIAATLIIVEVIPFLVLAVGVDNIFILVQTFQRDERRADETLKEQIGRVVGEIAPSMLLSSLSMSACFFIGALTPMPAVRMFALYAGVALVINFLLQMTCFLSIFVLDTIRQSENRLDILCCIKTKKSKTTTINGGLLYTFFRDIYSDFLLNDFVRCMVLFIFSAWLCSSIASLDQIHIGLEQELSMPDDSYMTDYFAFYKQYLQVGPPVYFMITDGYNYSDYNTGIGRLCDKPSCDKASFLKILNYWSTQPHRSYMSSKPSFWVPPYLEYLSTDKCCQVYDNGTQCFNTANYNSDCSPCIDRDTNGPLTVTKDEFDKYLPFFLNQDPNLDCSLGGKGLYDTSVKYKRENDGNIKIGPSYAMIHRKPLKTSHDFYESLRVSRQIADKLTRSLKRKNFTNATVRTYSFADVFYEQYLTMWGDTVRSLCLSIAAVFIVTYLFFGLDLHCAAIVSSVITMIIINLMGLMMWWDISLNAISLVNLVVVCKSMAFFSFPLIIITL